MSEAIVPEIPHGRDYDLGLARPRSAWDRIDNLPDEPCPNIVLRNGLDGAFQLLAERRIGQVDRKNNPGIDKPHIPVRKSHPNPAKRDRFEYSASGQYLPPGQNARAHVAPAPGTVERQSIVETTPVTMRLSNAIIGSQRPVTHVPKEIPHKIVYKTKTMREYDIATIRGTDIDHAIHRFLCLDSDFTPEQSQRWAIRCIQYVTPAAKGSHA